MNLGLSRWAFWPLVLATIFLSIPPLLFYLHPVSFWAGNDYEPLGLADALNLAYRIADRQVYSARGLMDHPGVPFYFMNWLALALTGYPVASRGPGFLDGVITHVEIYHQMTIWLGALIGAAGVYIFARSAQKLVPVSIIMTGLLVWLSSTPATLLEFEFPSIDLFGILINALFFLVLVRLAYAPSLTSGLAVLCGSVGAFSYLNKLSYIYVPAALIVVGGLSLVFRHTDRIEKWRLWILSIGSYVLIVVVTGVFIIGWGGFLVLIRFHKNIFLGSGLYGSGDRTVVNGHQIWHAIAAIPAEHAYSLVIALVGGASLAIGGFTTYRKGKHIPVALIGIGTGIASLLSAIFVMKHYDLHYTAGVAATLPSTIAGGYLLLRSRGSECRHQISATGVAVVALVCMVALTTKSLILVMSQRSTMSELAEADWQDIQSRLAGSSRGIEFTYKTPFAAYGEGFAVFYASVPRLTDEYVRSRSAMFSSIVGGLFDQDVGAYVIDKAFFPTAESIKAAPNVVPSGPKAVAFKDGDKLIELRTVFILIRG